jgi:hypothetical protein
MEEEKVHDDQKILTIGSDAVFVREQLANCTPGTRESCTVS